MSVRDAFSAGTKPHSAAEATEIARTKNTTFQSKLIGTALTYSLKLMFARTKLIPQYDDRRPTPPPRRAITIPSVNNCRTMRRRPAPREMRIASSFRRPAARASSRPATLPHAIISTKPTVVIITAMPARMPKF